MDFRSGSPSDNSGAEEMEVSLAKPKHRVVSLDSAFAGLPGLWRDLAGPGVPAWLPVWVWDPRLLLTWTELAEYLSSMHESPVLKESKMKMTTNSQGPVL